jgi:ubiquinone/menaquinone biosynthesis C-methylase UbiE
MRAVGMDLSAPLLESAKAKGPCTDHNCSYFRGDLRALPVKSNTCALVTNLFSSFGYFDTDDQNFAVLEELARVIGGGGFLVLDFMNAPHVKQHLEARSERHSAAGCHVTDARWISSDPERVNKRTLAVSSTGEQKEFFESVRLFTADELQQMIAKAGLTTHVLFGDYAGNPWHENSPRAIFIARKPS